MINLISWWSNNRKWLLLTLVVTIFTSLAMWAGRIVYSGKDTPVVADYTPWSEEVIETFAAVPVHHGDRIKPMSTYAKVLMLEYHGDLSIKFQDQSEVVHKVGPSAFLLDALLRPQFSRETPLFQVENSEVLTAIGMEVEQGSTHQSYNELEPFRAKLFELGQKYTELRKEEKELDITQTQTLALANHVRTYEQLLSYFNFARAGIVLPAIPGAEQEKLKYVATSAFMTMAGEIRQVLNEHTANGATEPPKHLIPVLQQVLNHANDAKYGPELINPNSDEFTWASIGDGIMNVFQGIDPDPINTITATKLMEDVYADYKAEDKTLLGSLKKASTVFQDKLSEQQLKDLKREVKYNESKHFFKAIFFCFLPAMIFIILSWLSPKSMFGRITYWLTAGFTTIGLYVTISGITQRALIMHRPPVGNLYDTIIFIAAGVVFIALVTELLTRRKLALSIAPFIGFFLLVLSWIYELEEGVDNLEPLIAVLRSNFWLTVHVPTITFGYAAGLATWLFGIVYLFVRLFGLDKDDPSLRRLISRMTYGSLAFCLLLSLIGTVTGGIWANDSWGRFWGWDPKENGALMIVLWTLFILHARLGGVIKEWGVHLSAIFTGPVVVFSWWHVNLLGVGLHSYGFSDSKSDAVNLFYTVNAVILLLGFATYLVQSGRGAKLLAKLKGGQTSPVTEEQ